MFVPKRGRLRSESRGERARSSDNGKDFRAEVILSLRVPNRLLFQWHRMVHKPRDYIPLLNSSIADKAVAIWSDCSQVGDNLACRAGRLRSQVESLRIELADTLVMADRQVTTLR